VLGILTILAQNIMTYRSSSSESGDLETQDLKENYHRAVIVLEMIALTGHIVNTSADC
jgi:hypothetical protein